VTGRRVPATKTARAAATAKPVIRGVAISSADRVMYPDAGITKLDLVRYVDAVADWLLPHVADRPLTLVFCPDGIAGECVYLKHGKTWGPSSLRRVKIREKTKVGEYMVADSPEALVAIMQMNWVEMHTWNACASSLERPNRLVVDLDPGPNVRWPQVVAAAREVREALESLGLKAWLKTTGGRGLHVVLPLLDGVSWEAGFAFADRLAETLVRARPRLYTTQFAKEGREAQILLDVLRNRRGSTVVSAYSPRARAGAPVSTPIAWDELSARRRPDRFTIRTIPARLTKLGADPWQDYWTCRQRLPGR
jgi:bifunctional non-homologous end joining protein LigD